MEYYRLTSNGIRIIKSVPAGQILGCVFKKTNNTGYIDKDYKKTAFGSFLIQVNKQTHKTANAVLCVEKKTGDIYVKTARRIVTGSLVVVDFNTMKVLGPKQKDKPTDWLTKPKKQFESNRETELGDVYGNYLAGTNWGKSYNA